MGASIGPSAGCTVWPGLRPPSAKGPLGKARQGGSSSGQGMKPRSQAVCAGCPRFPRRSLSLVAKEVQRDHVLPGEPCYREMTVSAKGPRDTVWKTFAHRPWTFLDAPAAPTSHLHAAESSESLMGFPHPEGVALSLPRDRGES